MNQITLPAADLKQALPGLAKVVSRKSSLPILQMVRLSRTAEGRVTLSATDLDTFVTYHLEQSQPGQPLDVLLPFEPLNKSGKGSEVIILAQTKDRAQLRYYVGGSPLEQSVATLAPAEFPPTPLVTQPAVKMPANFGETLRQAFATSSTDSTRYVLQGAYLDVSDPSCHTIVSTNGRVLFAANTFQFDLKEPVNLSRQKFLEWPGFLEGECGLAVKTDKTNGGWVRLTTPRWDCTIKQIDGQFPNWRSCVPENTDHWTRIRLSEPAIKQMLNLSDKLPGADTQHRTLQLNVTRELRLEGKNQDDQAFTGAVIEGVNISGPPVITTLNREYLQTALRCGLDEIRICNEREPLVFCHPGKRLVVMPVFQKPVEQPAKLEADPQTTKTTPEPNPAEERKIDMTEATETTEPSAIEKLETIKTKLRELLGELNHLTGLLKQVEKDKRSTEKEVASVRQTLRSLQGLKL